MEEKRLGKGLAALISASAINNDSGAYNENFDITKIAPNPWQPRMHIEPEDLISLADSIREHGIIQPLIITKDEKSDVYFLIAGERRFRAAQLAGLKVVPVVTKESSPQEMLELALIENIQRKDLNPLEEATAFKQLQEQFNLTQGDIAKKVGLSRVAVTNKIRLMNLPNEVKEAVLNEKLSEGHARALLGLTDESSLIAAANIVIRKEMSVRDTEMMVRKINFGKESTRKNVRSLSKETIEAQKKLSAKIGFTAEIQKLTTGGKVCFRYNNDKELQDLVTKILGN
ncbi:ParB/RepB/Spo0J family partition protein [Candidatus Dojkabacteria bacterium]|jgi:ParB family chromosome partitioning protein|nr:ParB/RepB/Spo0J family partition protein [Candidatus Dojkabacteria bacterium]